MINQKPEINQDEKPGMYRGSLIYLQARGYKIITMMVSLRAPGEQSCVICRAYGLSSMKEAEYIPAGPSVAAVDLYNFLVTDDTEITLTIKSRARELQARYIARSDGIEEDSSSLFWLDVIRSSKSIEKKHF